MNRSRELMRTRNRQHVARRQTEAQFQNAVTQLAHLTGWLAYHTHDSRRSQPGFPDLVLIHPERGMRFRELKTDTGRLTPDQRRWGDAITAAGGDWAVWRPRDWAAIEATLKGA